MRDNRGLTFIELVVTTAIIAIFSGVVLWVVSVSSNLFGKTSTEAKVQMETQEISDTLQNLVIDTNRSIYYTYGASEGSIGEKAENDIDHAGNGSDIGIKTLYMCNAKKVSESEELLQYDVVTWNGQTQEIRYSHRGITRAQGETDSLLAEHVTGFQVDISKVESQRIVRFRITIEDRGKEITTLHTVNLRNEIQVLPVSYM